MDDMAPSDDDTAMMMDDIPADLDFSTEKMSDNGLFNVSVTSNTSPVPLNEMHTWTLTVLNAAGEPVEDAEIIVDGGMPQHGHGLPTAPEVTENLGNGTYLVEGVRFNMLGWWEFALSISSADQQDAITFNLALQ